MTTRRALVASNVPGQLGSLRRLLTEQYAMDVVICNDEDALLGEVGIGPPGLLVLDLLNWWGEIIELTRRLQCEQAYQGYVVLLEPWPGVARDKLALPADWRVLLSPVTACRLKEAMVGMDQS